MGHTKDCPCLFTMEGFTLFWKIDIHSQRLACNHMWLAAWCHYIFLSWLASFMCLTWDGLLSGLINCSIVRSSCSLVEDDIFEKTKQKRHFKKYCWKYSIYSRILISVGDPLCDLPQICETTNSRKLYMQHTGRWSKAHKGAWQRP